jgi:hypothetical protein
MFEIWCIHRHHFSDAIGNITLEKIESRIEGSELEQLGKVFQDCNYAVNYL